MRRRLCAAVLALVAVGCRPSDPVTRDLARQFSLARIGTEPALIDLGSPEARRYLVSGWSHDEEADGATFVWGTGERSVLEFYVAEPRELALTFRCMPYDFPGASSQSVSFELNGAGGPRVSLSPGMADYHVVLPRAAMKEGWNRLVLAYAHARAPSEVTGATDTRRLAAAWDFIRLEADATGRGSEPTLDGARSTLVVPGGSGVSYYMRLSSKAVLRFDELAFSGGARTTLAVRIEADGKPGAVLARFDGARPRRDVRVRVPWSGIVRLSLDARGADASATVRVTRPAIELVAPAARSIAAPRPTHARPNVIIYLVDTLRADRLGCYGHDRPTSPHLDRFARDAIRYTDAVTEAPWTRAAVASLFTGLPALTHGVAGRADALPDEAVTMAEVFREAGYETAAFVTNGNVAPAYGFAQGFDVFELMPGTIVPGSDGNVPQPFPPPPTSAGVTRAALDWLDGRQSGRPFLLYLHTADPHAPYLPPPRFRDRLGVPADTAELGSLETLGRISAGTLPVDATLIGSLSLLYDGEVAENDEEFGNVLAGLRARGLYDDAMVVFVADHGEEFHEHNGWQHGHSVHAELEHVPLVVKRPGGEGAGTHVDRTVQLADVLATLVDYVHPDPAPALPGTSLFHDPDGGVERAAFAHLNLDGHLADAVVEGGWKLIATPDGYELFDRVADPGEQHDLAGEHPVIVGYLAMRLADHIASTPRALGARSAVMPDDVRQNLRALGYVQ